MYREDVQGGCTGRIYRQEKGAAAAPPVFLPPHPKAPGAFTLLLQTPQLSRRPLPLLHFPHPARMHSNPTTRLRLLAHLTCAAC
eukprot:361568-Chlamydomonas_euryale.AAC.1